MDAELKFGSAGVYSWPSSGSLVTAWSSATSAAVVGNNERGTVLSFIENATALIAKRLVIKPFHRHNQNEAYVVRCSAVQHSVARCSALAR